MMTKATLKTENSVTPQRILRLFAPLAWVGAIAWLSLTSSPPQISGVLGWDKLLHAGAYGLLTLLIAQALLCSPLNPHKVWWSAWLAAVGFGALMEILQLLAQTGRAAEWWDLFADAVGACLACVIFRQIVGSFWSQPAPLEKDHG